MASHFITIIRDSKKNTPLSPSLPRVTIVYRARVLIKPTNWTNIAMDDRLIGAFESLITELFLILSFGQWKNLPKDALYSANLTLVVKTTISTLKILGWRIQSIWLHYRFDKHYFSCNLLTNKSVSVYTKRGGSWQTNACLISCPLQDFCLLHELNHLSCHVYLH